MTAWTFAMQLDAVSRRNQKLCIGVLAGRYFLMNLINTVVWRLRWVGQTEVYNRVITESRRDLLMSIGIVYTIHSRKENKCLANMHQLMSFDKCLKQETLFSSKLWSLLRVDQAQKTIAKQQEYSMALDLVLIFFYAVTQTLTSHNQLFKFIQTVNCTNMMTALYVTVVFQELALLLL